MRLLFIRHGDRDYVNDCLTEKGRKDASLLNDYLKTLDLGDVYVSPFGRAEETCALATKGLNVTPVTQQWLQEYHDLVDLNRYPELAKAYSAADRRRPDGSYYISVPWDMLPSYLNAHPEFFDKDGWKTADITVKSNLLKEFEYRTSNSDALLEKYGYKHENDQFHCDRGSHQTLTFFTHLGCASSLLAHLLGISPFIMWQSFCMPATSLTEVYTEEREKGVVSFRIFRFGDVSHLSMNSESPAFSARFCETFEDPDRH